MTSLIFQNGGQRNLQEKASGLTQSLYSGPEKLTFQKTK